MTIEKDNKIILKAPAKINLHLEVIGKRDDNFHELSMIMQSIDLYDYLEMQPNKTKDLKLTSNCENLSLKEDNLIIKAGLLLKDYLNDNSLGANIFLKKNIPIGAGLAGGSTNAAAALVGLNKIWNLNINTNIIIDLAAKLGSDVPFCIKGGSQLAFGRGEILEKFDINSDHGLILIKNPKVSVSTADTYKKYSLKFCKNKSLASTKIHERREFLRRNGINNNDNLRQFFIRNDLQKIVIDENETVKNGLKLLSELENCLCYSMSGSGPSCYALFEDVNKAESCFKKNKEKLKSFGFDSWLCKFIEKGISII
tara:strand:- start:471 stop:1406 length:936 start_codon:yes stop_codon:yes gene_type:complete